ncbi:hypothetical protein [Arthrobacter sp. SDTb3-6]|uniref:hypothetical protein n=1 Tax=Arthrobacter sp. SDTb3-6 TaxID=2713571 RepID=UPI00159D04E1|nr:hypothetical protein [Arthrobacter sp. SDTb3-6]NVM97795.1 hypothetical protein [Arthrobacter sp. SDTb3-6]
MATRKLDLSTLTKTLVNEIPKVHWDTAADLSRISVEAMAVAATIGRTAVSTGSLRLTGDAVNVSMASMEAVGDLMAKWQRLVTAIGGSKRGFTGLRGRMNSGVVSSTKLLLNAGPAQGSVILEFQPATPPTDELSPTGEVGVFDEPDTQLVDESIGEAINIMKNAVALGPSADGSEFLGEVAGLGPRAASALSELAKTLDMAGFDMDLEWRQPSHPSLRVHVVQSVARQIVQVVTSRELDSDTETLTGHIQTITDVARIHLLLDDETLIPIKPGKIDHDALKPISHGDRVKIEADVKLSQRPGDEPTTTYTGRTIIKLAD